VNISGAEYDAGGIAYTYPTHAEIDYFASKGFTAIRLPFLLERVQPVMNGALSASELSSIDDVVSYAVSKGIKVILDPHNFGYAYGAQIGSASVPDSAFANFWAQFAGHFSSNSNVLFGLMNEPNDISATQWIGSVNAAIAAIRASGATSQQILVPGTYWDGAANWVSSDNDTVIGNGVVDPSNNFAFEVHQYLDSDGSGTHSDAVSATIGVERLAAVTAWAEATGNKLFLGEFGISSDAMSLAALNNMLSFMQQHSGVWEGGTYWAAGAWWGSYMYSVEPTQGVDKPQMGILDQYVPALSQTNGSIHLSEVGNQYYLYNSAGSGPSLKYSGANVVAGQFGAMTPIGAGETASGYQVAWKVTGSDQYKIWTTDSSGNYISNTGFISGTSNAMEALETSFHQDLNGDGVIGFSTTTLETKGSIILTEVGSNFYLENSGNHLSLKYAGAVVVAGQFGAWTPIGSEQTTTGYEVAWKLTGSDQYSVWSTDSSGNYTSLIIGPVSGNSIQLESVETSFHQDLNGDGTIGVPSSSNPPESTNLVEIGNNFYLTSDGGQSGPSLKYGGAAVVSGQFGAWAPIGSEQTASGYEVAWKTIGSDQYSVWNTDSSGNYTSLVIGPVSGNSAALESFETSFHQDLNGDGIIGVPSTTVIEALGSTKLVEVGNNFYLNNVGSGSGPSLKYAGADVVAGEFGAWTPIGAEQTAAGYEVAWKFTGSDQYSVWSTDSGGDFTSLAIGPVSGSNAALEAFETSFHQDLNGDGSIGVPYSAIALGSTKLVEIGNDFYLNSGGGGSGPSLKYAGAAVVAGQFGAWTPIAAGQTDTGYEVAWKITGADQYSVWSTDSNGNYTSLIISYASANSAALESFETAFHQDLNGDGVIGLAVHPGDSLELAGAGSQSVTFMSSTGTLKLDGQFDGKIFGFTGDGTLAGSDQIDLTNLNYNYSVESNSTSNSSTGLLEVSNGTSVVDLHFFGSYSQANFKFASGGHGGTIVYDPPVDASGTKYAAVDNGGVSVVNDTGSQLVADTGSAPRLALMESNASAIVNSSTVGIASSSTVNSAGEGQENFLFNSNFGQASIAHQVAVSESAKSLSAAIHENLRSITDATHDTIAIENIITPQLLAHLSESHFF
jgi:20S proteasome alpha/beta subunit